MSPNTIHVSRILVHPIKSCGGISVQSWKYTPRGLEYDREWCIIDAVTKCVITARAAAKMVLITPRIESDDSSPYGGLLTITFPADSGCQTFSVPLNPTDEVLNRWTIIPQFVLWRPDYPLDGYICEAVGQVPADSPNTILSKYFGKPVHLIYKGPRPRSLEKSEAFPEMKVTAVFQDKFPLLIMSEESMDEINQRVQEHIGTQGIEGHWETSKVTIERFRPNIVVRGGAPFIEDNWQEIATGSGPALVLVEKCPRCLLPNVSPDTGVRDKAVPYKILVKFRSGLNPKEPLKPYVGCNAVPVADGIIKVGDLVHVKKSVL